MELNQHEINEMADFFAKRFPTAQQRSALARDVGFFYVEDNVGSTNLAWVTFIQTALTNQLLDELIKVASAKHPEDKNMQALCDIMTGGPKKPLFASPAIPFAIGVAATALLFVGFSMGGSDGTDIAQTGDIAQTANINDQVNLHEATINTSTEGNISTALTNTNNDGVKTIIPEIVAGNPLDKAKELQAAATKNPKATKSNVRKTVEATAPPTVTTANEVGRCTLKEGGVVGYWYAGENRPGASGQTITMEYSVNVRADYPDAHNGFNARSPVRCGLLTGDTVKLSQDPILVPGDRYWVPILSGDLVAEAVATNTAAG